MPCGTTQPSSLMSSPSAKVMLSLWCVAMTTLRQSGGGRAWMTARDTCPEICWGWENRNQKSDSGENITVRKLDISIRTGTTQGQKERDFKGVDDTVSFISSGRVEWPWWYKHDHLTFTVPGGPSWGSKPVNIFIWCQQLCHVAANHKINSKTYRRPVERSQIRGYVKVGSGDAALWEAREKLFMCVWQGFYFKE